MAIDKYFLKSAVRTLRKIEKEDRITVATLLSWTLIRSETDLKNVC